MCVCVINIYIYILFTYVTYVGVCGQLDKVTLAMDIQGLSNLQGAVPTAARSAAQWSFGPGLGRVVKS